MIRRLVLALLLLGVSAAAHAHSVNFAVAFVTIEEAAVRVNLTITGTDVNRAAQLHIADPLSGMVDPARLRDAEPALARYIVEPAIAATIVLVALENFLSREVEGRWRWTFVLGLVHGFGFASVLAEHGLPRSALITSLAAFNIGVEIGQLAIVAIVLPLMWLADRAMANGAAPARKPALVYPFSALVMAAGLWWFAERTLLG